MIAKMPNFLFASFENESSRIDFYIANDKLFLYNGLIYKLNEESNHFVNQYGITMGMDMAKMLFDAYGKKETDK
jgi:hypothetical protein